jgi:hypothetical protein
VTPNTEKVSYISPKNIDNLEAFLGKYAEVPEEDKPGLRLDITRNAYQENISQINCY